MPHQKTKQQRTVIAENAIFLLRQGINTASNLKIKAAYDLVEDDNGFSWDDLDVIFTEWDDLLEESNDILMS